MIVDFLSRLEHTTKKEMTNDVFLYDHLFVVSITKPWFTDIENYLAVGRFPQHFTYKEKSRIVRQSAYF